MGLVTVAHGPAFPMCTRLDGRCSVGRGSAGFPVEKGKQTRREERRRRGGGACRGGGGAGVSPPESGCPLGCPELTSSQLQTREAPCLLLCSVHTHVLLRSALLGRGTVTHQQDGPQVHVLVEVVCPWSSLQLAPRPPRRYEVLPQVLATCVATSRRDL